MTSITYMRVYSGNTIRMAKATNESQRVGRMEVWKRQGIICFWRKTVLIQWPT